MVIKLSRIGLIASLAIASILPANAEMDKKTSDGYLMKAKAYAEARDYSSALKIYEYLSKNFPNESTFYFISGELYSALKQPQKALSCFEKAEDLLKKNPKPRFVLTKGGSGIILAKGDCYWSLKNYPKAEECFTSALKQGGKLYNEALLSRTDFYLKTNNLAKAQSDLAEAKKLSLAGSELHYCAFLASRMGQFLDAEKFIKKANLKKPFDVRILADGAYCLYELGKDDEALSWFNQAVDAKGTKPSNLYSDMAQLEKNMGKVELAQDHAQVSIKIQKEDKSGKPVVSMDHVNLAIAYTILSDYERANQEISTAKKLDPTNLEADRQTGRILMLQNKFEEALAAYNNYLGKGIACRGYSERAHVLNALGKKEEAAKDLQTAQSKGYMLADKEMAELNKN